MTAITNDDFDACCGNRPRIFIGRKTGLTGSGHWAICGICGDRVFKREMWRLMEAWNKRQSGKVKLR